MKRGGNGTWTWRYKEDHAERTEPHFWLLEEDVRHSLIPLQLNIFHVMWRADHGVEHQPRPSPVLVEKEREAEEKGNSTPTAAACSNEDRRNMETDRHLDPGGLSHGRRSGSGDGRQSGVGELKALAVPNYAASSVGLGWKSNYPGQRHWAN